MIAPIRRAVSVKCCTSSNFREGPRTDRRQLVLPAHGPERGAHPREGTSGPLEARWRHGRPLHPRRVRWVGAEIPLGSSLLQLGGGCACLLGFVCPKALHDKFVHPAFLIVVYHLQIRRDCPRCSQRGESPFGILDRSKCQVWLLLPWI